MIDVLTLIKDLCAFAGLGLLTAATWMLHLRISKLER